MLQTHENIIKQTTKSIWFWLGIVFNQPNPENDIDYQYYFSKNPKLLLEKYTALNFSNTLFPIITKGMA